MDPKHNSSITSNVFLVPTGRDPKHSQGNQAKSQATNSYHASRTQGTIPCTQSAPDKQKQQVTQNNVKNRPVVLSHTPFTITQAIENQIKKNQDIASKLSPIVKYKVQEFLRKKRAKCPQRRKFSIRHGALQRFGKQQLMRLKSSLQPQSSNTPEAQFPPILSFTTQPQLNYFMANGGDIDLD